MATMWEYDAVKLDGDSGRPGPEHVRAGLGPHGDQGYRVIHVRDEPDGGLLVILGRDTGRPVQAREAPTSAEWLEEGLGGWNDS